MQLTQYPRVRQGEQTRQRLLTAITEDPTATLNELSLKLCLSTSQVRRQRKYLKILGFLPLVVLVLFTFTLSGYANEIFISEGESIESVESVDVEEADFPDDEPVEEVEPDEKLE
ncbi:hypothetical protein QUA70_19755 [Microcoleus sp. LAD1_D5]|uniref:hypothetical protein n=1 Tax=Microcoleus sp. LAD1_D5 TaxID=2818813 RepID=UPI002FD30122